MSSSTAAGARRASWRGGDQQRGQRPPNRTTAAAVQQQTPPPAFRHEEAPLEDSDRYAPSAATAGEFINARLKRGARPAVSESMAEIDLTRALREFIGAGEELPPPVAVHASELHDVLRTSARPGLVVTVRGVISAPFSIPSGVTVQGTGGATCDVSSDQFAVVLEGELCVLRGVNIINRGAGGGVRVTRARTVVADCTVTARAVGVSIQQYSEVHLTRCHLSHCEIGVEVKVGPNHRPIVEGCRFHGCRHGMQVTKGKPWVFESDFVGNRNCGLVFEAEGDGVVRRCTIQRNGTQGVFVSTRPSMAIGRVIPLILECSITNGRASGVKVTGGGEAEIVRCEFEANEDRDVDVEDQSRCTVAGCRFGGKSAKGIGGWPGASLRLLSNRFLNYSFWAIAADRSDIEFGANTFLAYEPDSAVWSRRSPALDASNRSHATGRPMGAANGEADQGGSGSADIFRSSAFAHGGGMLLFRCRGSAVDNVFVGFHHWDSTRVAYCLDGCVLQRNSSAALGCDELAASPPLRAAIMDICASRIGSVRTSRSDDKEGDPATADVSEPGRAAGRRLLVRSDGGEGGLPSSNRGGMGDTAFAVLLEAIRVDTSLEAVDISGQSLSDASLRKLGSVVRHHSGLRSVGLRRLDGVSEDGLVEFFDAVSTAPVLDSVDFSDFPMATTERVLDAAVRSVERNSRLTTFAVGAAADADSKRSIRAEEMLDDLAFFTKINQHVPAGAPARAQLQLARRNDASVNTLDVGGAALGGCDTDTVISLVGLSLRRNTAVTALHLDARQIETRHLAALGAAIAERGAHLRTLSLSRNLVDDLRPLADALQSVNDRSRHLRTTRRNVPPANSLTAIDLSHNRLSGATTAVALRDMLGDGRGSGAGVLQLNLASNWFSSGDIDVIVAAVPHALLHFAPDNVRGPRRPATSSAATTAVVEEVDDETLAALPRAAPSTPLPRLAARSLLASRSGSKAPHQGSPSAPQPKATPRQWNSNFTAAESRHR